MQFEHVGTECVGGTITMYMVSYSINAFKSGVGVLTNQSRNKQARSSVDARMTVD